MKIVNIKLEKLWEGIDVDINVDLDTHNIVRKKTEFPLNNTIWFNIKAPLQQNLQR